MKFEVIFPDGGSQIIIRDCKETVVKYLQVSGIYSEDVVITPIDFYQELRGISLTHLQCSQVIELLDSYGIDLFK